MLAARRYLFALVAVLFLVACDRAPTLPRLSPHDVILAFGDSLTHGTGASEETAYPAVLASLTGHTVINAGVPGDTTATGLQRLPAVLAEYKPRLVLLCLGGNDMLHKQPAATTENNLRCMVQTIRASGAERRADRRARAKTVRRRAAISTPAGQGMQLPWNRKPSTRC